jgi:hypothetical protein
MAAIDFIRRAMQTSDQVATRLIDDMREQCLTQPTARGGNHPLWVIGHLAYSEGVLRRAILGEPNPVGDWANHFAPGSRPSVEADRYPAFDEVLAKYRELRAANVRLLDDVGEAGLDRPVKIPPPGLEAAFGTIGDAILTIAFHQMMHGGQVTDCRRAVGRKPAFPPPAV